MSDEVAGIVGLDVCPHCGGTDHAKEKPVAARNKEFVRLDVVCENCGQGWTIEYLPAAYHKPKESAPIFFPIPSGCDSVRVALK